MTTATAPHIIATDDRRYAIMENTTVVVVARSHDFDSKRRSLTLNNIDENNVALSAADCDRHATFYLSREEARLFAQAILDATA